MSTAINGLSNISSIVINKYMTKNEYHLCEQFVREL